LHLQKISNRLQTGRLTEFVARCTLDFHKPAEGSFSYLRSHIFNPLSAIFCVSRIGSYPDPTAPIRT
jgi:hypothetical protein